MGQRDVRGAQDLLSNGSYHLESPSQTVAELAQANSDFVERAVFKPYRHQPASRENALRANPFERTPEAARKKTGPVKKEWQVGRDNQITEAAAAASQSPGPAARRPRVGWAGRGRWPARCACSAPRPRRRTARPLRTPAPQKPGEGSLGLTPGATRLSKLVGCALSLSVFSRGTHSACKVARCPQKPASPAPQSSSQVPVSPQPPSASPPRRHFPLCLQQL